MKKYYVREWTKIQTIYVTMARNESEAINKIRHRKEIKYEGILKLDSKECPEKSYVAKEIKQ